METNWRKVSYEEFDVPPILYKFREWGKPFHKTILTDRVVYLSPPSGFEDPLDCKVPIRWDLLSHRELNKRFFEHSERRHPNWSRTRHKKWAKGWMKRTPLKNPLRYKSILGKFEKLFDNIFGVLCLTPVVDNFEMWESDYAGNHKGFCVGFDGKAMLSDYEKFGATGPINYYAKLPIIHPNEELLTKAVKQTFSKLEKWSFEKEYRTTKFKPDGEKGDDWRKVIIPDKRFVEVVFGAMIPEHEKQEITQIIQQRFPRVKLRQAEIDFNNRTVTISDLP